MVDRAWFPLVLHDMMDIDDRTKPSGLKRVIDSVQSAVKLRRFMNTQIIERW